MLERLKSKTKNLIFFRPKAVVIGVETKLRFDYNTALEGINRVKLNLPFLSETDFNKDEEEFILRNSDPEPEKQVVFVLKEFSKLSLLWGAYAELDFETSIKKFLNSVEKGFKFDNSFNINLIDVKVYMETEWSGHHYKAIWQTFMSNSPLNGITDPDNILQNDLFIRILLDDSRVCVISVKSDIEYNNILNRKFDNRTLIAFTGIGQTRNIPSDSAVSEIFTEHLQISSGFILGKFIPKVVEPLDRVLGELSKIRNSG